MTDKELRKQYHRLARWICAAWVGHRTGMPPQTAARQITEDPEELAPLWYRLARAIDVAASQAHSAVLSPGQSAETELPRKARKPRKPSTQGGP